MTADMQHHQSIVCAALRFIMHALIVQMRDIPAELGLCTALQSLQVAGNLQKALRPSTLDKGISHVLQFLRDKLPACESGGVHSVRQPCVPPPAIRPVKPVQSSSTSSMLKADRAAYDSRDDEGQSNNVASGDAQTLPVPPTQSEQHHDHLSREIAALQEQIEAPGLSQAKAFALKKQMQMKRAQLIRAQRQAVTAVKP